MFATRYQEVLNQLRGRIESGAYGEKMPSIRALCAEFGVCKSTMSKAFARLADAGVIQPTRRGTFLCGAPAAGAPGGVVAVISGILRQEDDGLFIRHLQDELRKLRFASALIEVSDENWRNPDFWRRLDFDGYIFVYSSYYKLLLEHITFCAKPRVVGNWLPDEIEEYFVDFSDEAGLEEVVLQILALGYRNIALATSDVLGNSADPYHASWRKMMRRHNLFNYNSAIEDFFYSERTVRHWAGLKTPPEFVLCAQIMPETVERDMRRYGREVVTYNLGENREDYLRLAEALAHTFAAVYTGKGRISRRNLIGRYGKVNLPPKPECPPPAANASRTDAIRKRCTTLLKEG